MTHYLVALALAVGAVGSWQVQEWRYGAKERERWEATERDRRQAEKRVDVAAVSLEADRRQLRTQFIVITEEVERVVKEPFYAGGELCLDDAGLRELGAAVAPSAAASQPARAVPGSGRAEGR